MAYFDPNKRQSPSVSIPIQPPKRLKIEPLEELQESKLTEFGMLLDSLSLHDRKSEIQSTSAPEVPHISPLSLALEEAIAYAFTNEDVPALENEGAEAPTKEDISALLEQVNQIFSSHSGTGTDSIISGLYLPPIVKN